MLNLIFAILSSTAIALILKQSSIRKGNPVILLCANYLVATLISLVRFFTDTNSSFSLDTLLFGAGLGLSFFLSFFAFTKAIDAAGTALATVSSRLSVIIPVILSIFIYAEAPGEYKAAGFLFTFITIVLFYFSIKRNATGSLKLFDYAILLLLLAGIGINDFAFKIFEHWGPGSDDKLFLLSIFSSAFVFSLFYVLIRKIKIETGTMVYGFILGVPNILASVFLLGALTQLPAILVFPAANIGIIIFTTLGAMMIFGERINTAGKWAIAAGIIAVGLLTL